VFALANVGQIMTREVCPKTYSKAKRGKDVLAKIVLPRLWTISS